MDLSWMNTGGLPGISNGRDAKEKPEVQTWQVKDVNKDTGTLLVNAYDRLSLPLNIGYRSGPWNLINTQGTGMASSRDASVDSGEKPAEEIIESYEVGDQIAVATPAGELGKAFIIKKLTGMRAGTSTNLVIGNGQD